MEDNKIVKVYSNNSKKSRLKRRKNKFQRVWDAEKKTYIKVRKAKYHTRVKVKKDWKSTNNELSLKRRQGTPKKPKKSVPVIAKAKPETTQRVQKEPPRIHGKLTNAVEKTKIYSIGRVNYTWDSATLHYKRVA